MGIMRPVSACISKRVCCTILIISGYLKLTFKRFQTGIISSNQVFFSQCFTSITPNPAPLPTVPVVYGNESAGV